MEFRESVAKYSSWNNLKHASQNQTNKNRNKNNNKRVSDDTDDDADDASMKQLQKHTPTTSGGGGRSSSKWTRMISVSFFQRSKSEKPNQRTKSSLVIPSEFLCPVTNILMADPVIVSSSGHSLERAAVLLCRKLGLTPTLPDGSIPDFKSIQLIPNLALKSTILNFCFNSNLPPPTPPDPAEIEPVLRALTVVNSHSFISFSSHEPESSEEEQILLKFRSEVGYEVEDAVASLRRTTRASEACRADLCTPRLLSALKPLLVSRHPGIQVNALAALVNLSLDGTNKVRIVRSGITPLLVNIVKGGESTEEAQEHACAALFSLAIDEANKTAIGVLGALQPLLHTLMRRSGSSEATRNNSALALYHLSRVQSNRSKLVKLGAVQMLLHLVKSGQLVNSIMMILYNMASCQDCRATMLDAGAVHLFLSMLLQNESMSESCLAALYGLAQGGLRFKILAKEAKAMDVLTKMDFSSSERAMDYASRIMEVLKEKREDSQEDVDWEELIDSGLANRYQSGLASHSGCSSES